jgi:hypothetical protein
VWVNRGPETVSASRKVVDKLYRERTRSLFRLITGIEWKDETQAYAALNEWLEDQETADKENRDTNDPENDSPYDKQQTFPPLLIVCHRHASSSR